LSVPNGFARTGGFTISTTLTATRRTAPAAFHQGGDWIDCATARAYLDFTPFKGELPPAWASNTRFRASPAQSGETGQFRRPGKHRFPAPPVTSPLTTGIAFGVEHIIQLDDTTDLGRNFSTWCFPACRSAWPEPESCWWPPAGIGSDFYGFGGHGTLGSTKLPEWRNNVTSLNLSRRHRFASGDPSAPQPSPAGLSQVLDRLRVVLAFGIGAGISVRPIKTCRSRFPSTPPTFSANTPLHRGALHDAIPCETALLRQAWTDVVLTTPFWPFLQVW